MLKTVIETTEGLNEALVPFYKEQDGKFHLQIEGVREHPDVLNLVNAYERVKADREAVKADRDKLKALADDIPEDFDADKWAKLKDGKADEAAQIQLRQEYEAKIEDLQGQLTATQEKALKNALDRDLTDALSEAGVTNPDYATSASTRQSEDGSPYVETDMGPLRRGEHVKRGAAGDGKDFVTAPKGGGGKGGEGGGKSTNPLLSKVPALADLPEK